MRALIVSAVFAVSVLATPPVFAKTYEEAAASGVSPVTGSEMFTCAIYWDTWAQSLDPDYYAEGNGIWDPKWIATLNSAIQLPAAQDTAEYWFERAEAEFEANDESEEFDKLLENAPQYDVEALDERKFMQWLGECARPAE